MNRMVDLVILINLSTIFLRRVHIFGDEKSTIFDPFSLTKSIELNLRQQTVLSLIPSSSTNVPVPCW